MRRRYIAPFAALLVSTTTLGFACRPVTRETTAERCQEPAPVTSSSAITTTAAKPKTPEDNHSAGFLALRDMPEKDACSLPLKVEARPGRKGAKPFTLEVMGESCGLCDYIETAPQRADACYISMDRIRAAETKAQKIAGGVAASSNPWDGRAKPKYFDRIDAHLHLDDAEEEMLRKNGFVVLDRLPYADYGHAFHDIFQEQLPLYVGVDPILHAVYKATDTALSLAEKNRLGPALTKMLAKLHKGLTASKGVYDETTRKDLDLYLGVASEFNRTWEADKRPASLFQQEEAIDAMVDFIGKGALGEVNIFGRERMIDASQYTPRGHYAHSDAYFNFESYFRTLTWLTRFEWNLVSRDSRSSHPGAVPDPRETPREARDALALADLFRRSGALAELQAFEEVYEAFGGHREDVGITELLKLMDGQHIAPNASNAPEALKLAIGQGYRRTARMHFMPQGVKELPVITTLIGARVAADIAPLTKLVHDATPNRHELGAADVAYVLGHDRAKEYLKDDLSTYSELGKSLEGARKDLEQRANQSADVQGSFFDILLNLSRRPEGIVPSFMRRSAFDDFRMSSTLVGYAQLRHTFVLLSGQGYDAYGCEIPDGYVEPAKPFYDALIKHVERLHKITNGGHEGLLRVLRTLSMITQTELARGNPTKDQATWLAMVAEFIPPGAYVDSGDPPKWTGWYFDMFEDREDGASDAADLIADYFTLTNSGNVAYLGTEGPRLGVFIVDVGGEPRAMVGPVARGYEVKGPISGRYADLDARKLKNKAYTFRDSFAAKPRPIPPLGLGIKSYECAPDGKIQIRVLAASDRPLGPVTITLLDHHGDPLAPPLTLDVTDDMVVFPFSFPDLQRKAEAPKQGPAWEEDFPGHERIQYLVEAISVRVEDLSISGLGKGSYDYFTSPSVYYGENMNSDSDEVPMRPTGAGEIVIGGEWRAAPKLEDDW